MTEQTTGNETPFYEREDAHRAMVAILQAGHRVRGGLPNWLKGAPTHVLAELLGELDQDDWHLRYEPAPSIGEGREVVLTRDDIGVLAVAIQHVHLGLVKSALQPAEWKALDVVSEKLQAALDFPSTTPREDGDDDG